MKLIFSLVISFGMVLCAWASSSSGDHIYLDNINAFGDTRPHYKKHKDITHVIDVDGVELHCRAALDLKGIQEKDAVILLKTLLVDIKSDSPLIDYEIIGFEEKGRSKRSSYVKKRSLNFQVKLNVGSYDKDQRVEQLSLLTGKLVDVFPSNKTIESVTVESHVYTSTQMQKGKDALMDKAKLKMTAYAKFARELNPGMSISVIPHINSPSILESNIHRIRLGLNFSTNAHVVKGD